MSKKKEVETVQIGEKFYRVDSLTEAGRGLIGDIQKVNSVIQFQQLQINAAILGKQKIQEALEAEAEKFIEVEPPKAKE